MLTKITLIVNLICCSYRVHIWVSVSAIFSRCGLWEVFFPGRCWQVCLFAKLKTLSLRPSMPSRFYPISFSIPHVPCAFPPLTHSNHILLFPDEVTRINERKSVSRSECNRVFLALISWRKFRAFHFRNLSEALEVVICWMCLIKSFRNFSWRHRSGSIAWRHRFLFRHTSRLASIQYTASLLLIAAWALFAASLLAVFAVQLFSGSVRARRFTYTWQPGG